MNPQHLMKRLAGRPMLAAALIPGTACGAGYYLPNQDAFATARGNAFVATADTPAAVHYNPAGLTQLEEASIQAGFYSIVLGNRSNAGGAKSKAKSELQAARTSTTAPRSTTDGAGESA